MTISTLIILTLFIGIAFFFDIIKQIIPNKLIVIFLPIGFLNSFVVGEVGGLVNSVLAMLLAGGLMMIAYLMKGLGAGDVKLMAVIGIISGIEYTLYCMFYSVIIGGVLAILIMFVTRTPLKNLIEAGHALLIAMMNKTRQPIEVYQATKASTMPFMWAVVHGAILAYYYVFLVG